MTILIDVQKAFDEMKHYLYIYLGTALDQEWLTLVVVTQHLACRRDTYGGRKTNRPIKAIAPVVTCYTLQEGVSITPNFSAGAGPVALVLLCRLIISRQYWERKQCMENCFLAPYPGVQGLLFHPTPSKHLQGSNPLFSLNPSVSLFSAIWQIPQSSFCLHGNSRAGFRQGNQHFSVASFSFYTARTLILLRCFDHFLFG